MRKLGILVIAVALSACGGSVTDASVEDGSVPSETSVVTDSGTDPVTPPTPSGCEKVPTVPAYTGGTACTTAVANSCDCVPLADLTKGPLDLGKGPVIALAGLTPKGDAIVQLRRGATWSCPVTIAGGPWVQIEWVGKRVVLRDDKGALFVSELGSSPFAMGPVKPLMGAETDLPFGPTYSSFGALVGIAYARRSDGVIETRASEPGGFGAPEATTGSTKVAFSMTSGALVYAHADGFVHLVTDKDEKTTVPNGVAVGALWHYAYGFASDVGYTIFSIDAVGRVQASSLPGCAADLCTAQFAEWGTFPAGSFVYSYLNWTRDGRTFELHSGSGSTPREVKTDEPVLFRRTLFSNYVEVFARASDCGLRLVESSPTSTLRALSVVPRTVLASPPSLVKLTF